MSLHLMLMLTASTYFMFNGEVLQNVDPSENLVLMILRDDNVHCNNTGTEQKV